MILVIDYDDDVRRTVANALRILSYETEEADDAASALALVRARQPELVILDHPLPDMDGFDLAREIWTIVPDVPLILTSTCSGDAEVQRLAAGKMPVLQKPFRLGELAGLVDDVLCALRQ